MAVWFFEGTIFIILILIVIIIIALFTLFTNKLEAFMEGMKEMQVEQAITVVETLLNLKREDVLKKEETLAAIKKVDHFKLLLDATKE